MPGNLKKATTPPANVANFKPLTPAAPIAMTPPTNASADPEFNPLAIAPVPTVLGTDTDAARQFYRTGVSQLRIPPLPPASKIAAGAAAKSQTIIQASGGSVELKTNNAPNPDQNQLNLTGPGVSYGPNPGQVQFAQAESSENAFELIDNFPFMIGAGTINGTSSPVGIGQLGWSLVGNGGSFKGLLGGVFPNLGQYSWSNTSSASQAGWLTFDGAGNYSDGGYSQNTYALADNPGTTLTFIFKFDSATSLSSSPTFAVLQTAMYVGVTGPNTGAYASAPYSRPDLFIGVRYDTSTSAPSINDAFFTLEVVMNEIVSAGGYARNNTQGTTFVTDVVPESGVFHTLTITFNVGGTVTVTLDGSATNTLTAAIPTLSVAATLSIASQNNVARLNWTVGVGAPQSFWNSGSQITVGGFTSTLAPLNGLKTLIAADENFIGFNQTPNVSSFGSEAATLEGFPTFIPLFMAGNDDTSTPTASTWLFAVDYFSMIWNPA